ncbi:MAG: hypothetical protein DRN11_02780 [Thermoplasmata archaeon]|nr:MAG: hypothetical protein DRN11_02780 [Thermoplasmata archaeon]
MLIVCLYVLFGGMRATGWTDVLQGAIMIFAMLLAFLFVAYSLGGFEKATQLAYESNPSLFSRHGPNNYYTIQIWISFLILWVFCNPMFPQLFMRFYTAKSQESLKKAMIFILCLSPLFISSYDDKEFCS